jgi:N-acetylglucosamine malate deacetylase 2
MALSPLAATRSALAVIAHPDDESFGLGSVLARLTGDGVRVRVLCLTRGEASTLGDAPDLASVRPRELACAAARLAVHGVSLLDYPDGGLADVPSDELERVVDEHIGDADAVIVFEPGGVTAHPDHQVATRAAERVALGRDLTVVEWGVSHEVAAALNIEFGTGFVGVDGDDVDVDRTVQWSAIACHRSQARDNPVLRRRLQLQGGRERVRVGAAADLVTDHLTGASIGGTATEVTTP